MVEAAYLPYMRMLKDAVITLQQDDYSLFSTPIYPFFVAIRHIIRVNLSRYKV